MGQNLYLLSGARAEISPLAPVNAKIAREPWRFSTFNKSLFTKLRKKSITKCKNEFYLCHDPDVKTFLLVMPKNKLKH